MKRTHVFSLILFISLVAIFFVGCGERTVVENIPDNVLVNQYEGIKTLPDPDLASLVLTNSGSSAVSYTPSFDKDTTTYTATVANGVSTISFLATTSHSNATMTINGTTTFSGVASTPLALSVGVNNFALAVTAQDGGTVKTYNVNVTRAGTSASSDNTLSNLVLSPTNITSFSSGTTSYSFTVAADVTSVNVTPTANHGAATITVNSTSVTSGNSQAVSLSAGANVISVVVTAEDASTRTYTVTVTRDAPTFSSLAPNFSFEDGTGTISTTGNSLYNWKKITAGTLNFATGAITAADGNNYAYFSTLTTSGREIESDYFAIDSSKNIDIKASFYTPEAVANTTYAIQLYYFTDNSGTAASVDKNNYTTATSLTASNTWEEKSWTKTPGATSSTIPADATYAKFRIRIRYVSSVGTSTSLLYFDKIIISQP